MKETAPVGLLTTISVHPDLDVEIERTDEPQIHCLVVLFSRRNSDKNDLKFRRS